MKTVYLYSPARRLVPVVVAVMLVAGCNSSGGNDPAPASASQAQATSTANKGGDISTASQTGNSTSAQNASSSNTPASTTPARAWSQSIAIGGSAQGLAQMPAVGMDAAGNGTVVWEECGAGASACSMMANRYDFAKSAWAGPAVIDDGTRNVGNAWGGGMYSMDVDRLTPLAVNANGDAVTIWLSRDGELWSNHFSGKNGKWDGAIQLAGTYSVGIDYLDVGLAIGAGGNASVVINSASGLLIHVYDAASGTWKTPYAPGVSLKNVGAYFAADNNLFIAGFGNGSVQILQHQSDSWLPVNSFVSGNLNSSKVVFAATGAQKLIASWGHATSGDRPYAATLDLNGNTWSQANIIAPNSYTDAGTTMQRMIAIGNNGAASIWRYLPVDSEAFMSKMYLALFDPANGWQSPTLLAELSASRPAVSEESDGSINVMYDSGGGSVYYLHKPAASTQWQRQSVPTSDAAVGAVSAMNRAGAGLVVWQRSASSAKGILYANIRR